MNKRLFPPPPLYVSWLYFPLHKHHAASVLNEIGQQHWEADQIWQEGKDVKGKCQDCLRGQAAEWRKFSDYHSSQRKRCWLAGNILLRHQRILVVERQTGKQVSQVIPGGAKFPCFLSWGQGPAVLHCLRWGGNKGQLWAPSLSFQHILTLGAEAGADWSKPARDWEIREDFKCHSEDFLQFSRKVPSCRCRVTLWVRVFLCKVLLAKGKSVLGTEEHCLFPVFTSTDLGYLYSWSLPVCFLRLFYFEAPWNTKINLWFLFYFSFEEILTEWSAQTCVLGLVGRCWISEVFLFWESGEGSLN